MHDLQTTLAWSLEAPAAPSRIKRRMRQGQGANTEEKERGIERALTITMKVCALKGRHHASYPAWHMDLNCGSGMNEDAKCIGSPLAWWNAKKASGKKDYRAYFFDKSAESINALHQRPEFLNNEKCFLFAKNNREALPILAKSIEAREKPKYAMGSIICDPNGWFYGDAVPVEELREFCQKFPRIDMILNLNVRTYQLMRGKVKNGYTKYGTILGVADLPRFLNRAHWLIRGPLQKGGGNRFVLLIGRNLRMHEDGARGFYHMDSVKGRKIQEEIECISDRTVNTSGTLCFE